MESKRIYNLIILDESGSMASIKDVIISGLNEVLQNVRNSGNEFPDLEQFVTFISFNSAGIKNFCNRSDLTKMPVIDGSNYRPDALTPLFDAMGSSINKLKYFLQDKKDYNVLVTILTDGLENASREFNGRQIKEMIEELKNSKWTFTYIGTDHDVDKFAESISINNRLAYCKNEPGVASMYERESKSRMNYMRNVVENKDVSFDYFKYKRDDENERNDNGPKSK